MNIFNELYKYREFLKTSILKEFRGKYKKSFLGVLWSFINPLMQLLIYSLIFGYFMGSDIEHYSIFLVVALIPWTFTSTTITQSVSSIIANSGIIKKVYFPREILPISTVTTNLINFLISTIIIIAALLISGLGLSKYILFLPLVVLIQYLFLMGAGFIISSVTVYIRDLEYFVNVLIMMWFYLNPIIYSIDIVPKSLVFVYNLNPMVHIINAYRDILYFQKVPNMEILAFLFIICLGLLFLGYFIFKKAKKRFAEEL